MSGDTGYDIEDVPEHDLKDMGWRCVSQVSRSNGWVHFSAREQESGGLSIRESVLRDILTIADADEADFGDPGIA